LAILRLVAVTIDEQIRMELFGKVDLIVTLMVSWIVPVKGAVVASGATRMASRNTPV